MTYTSNAALETLDSRKTSQGLTPISNIQVRRTMFHHMLSFVHSVVPKWNTRNRPFQGATMRNSSSALKTSGCHDGVGVAGDEVPTQVVHNELVHASLQWPYESTLPPCCTIHTHPDRRSQGILRKVPQGCNKRRTAGPARAVGHATTYSACSCLHYVLKGASASKPNRTEFFGLHSDSLTWKIMEVERNLIVKKLVLPCQWVRV